MKEFVEYVLRNLVDFPDEVSVDEVNGSSTIILEIRAKKEDMGKIIGKQGKTINAVRHLVHSLASRNNSRITIEILE